MSGCEQGCMRPSRQLTDDARKDSMKTHLLRDQEMTQQHTSKQAAKRQFEWNEVSLLGRFCASNGEEHACDIEQISPIGVICSTGKQVLPSVGEHTILYVDVLGRFTGTIVSAEGSSFQVELDLTFMKRMRLAEKLAELKFDGVPDQPERPRLLIEPKTLVTEDGIAHECHIINMSMWGAFVKTAIRPRIGSKVMLGKTTGTVSRHDENGLRIAFPVLHERRRHPR